MIKLIINIINPLIIHTTILSLDILLNINHDIIKLGINPTKNLKQLM